MQEVRIRSWELGKPNNDQTLICPKNPLILETIYEREN